MQLHQRHEGFSLIELMLVLTLVGILASISIPFFMAIYRHIKSVIASDQLLHAIMLARNEAVSKQTTVTLCKSSDQKTCGGDWMKGYIIFSEQALYAAFKNPELDGKIKWRAFPMNKDNLQFLASGFSKTENGTFWYCGLHANHPSWAIIMNQAGRVRVAYPDGRNEIVDDKNHPLICEDN